MTRQELITRVRTHKRSMSHAWGAWLVVFLGIVLSNIPIGKARTADPSSGVWLMLHLLSLLVLAAGVAFLICFWRRKVRQCGLACPICEKAIVGGAAHAAEATGRCRECGARIVEEEPEEEEPEAEEQLEDEAEADEEANSPPGEEPDHQ